MAKKTYWLTAQEAFGVVCQRVPFVGRAQSILEDAIKRGGVKMMGWVYGEIAERTIAASELEDYELMMPLFVCKLPVSQRREKNDIHGFRVERGGLIAYLDECYPADQYCGVDGDTFKTPAPEAPFEGLVALAKSMQSENSKMPNQDEFWFRAKEHEFREFTVTREMLRKAHKVAFPNLQRGRRRNSGENCAE